MVCLYNERQHSCLLYIGSVLADEYGGNKTAEAVLIEMLKVLCLYQFLLSLGFVLIL